MPQDGHLQERPLASALKGSMAEVFRKTQPRSGVKPGIGLCGLRAQAFTHGSCKAHHNLHVGLGDYALFAPCFLGWDRLLETGIRAPYPGSGRGCFVWVSGINLWLDDACSMTICTHACCHLSHATSSWFHTIQRLCCRRVGGTPMRTNTSSGWQLSVAGRGSCCGMWYRHPILPRIDTHIAGACAMQAMPKRSRLWSV